MKETLRLEVGCSEIYSDQQLADGDDSEGALCRPGQLPSEAKLSELFRVNRTRFVRLFRIWCEGLVQKKNGVGSFVLGSSLHRLSIPATYFQFYR